MLLQLYIPQAGITPACAGTTKLHLYTGSGSWDHPRLCGDHTTGMNPCGQSSGSPPPVRGPPAGALCEIAFTRITPACAGTTDQWVNFLLQLQDHPRLCGDHLGRVFCDKFNLGSPPPVRGPLNAWRFSGICKRITPACAGTTAN